MKFPHFLSDGLSAEFKTPCIMFAGHPSLRIGDSVHFMEFWGADPKNTVILVGEFDCLPTYWTVSLYVNEIVINECLYN